MTNETDSAPKAFSPDDQCLADLEASHWHDGVCCPACRVKDLLEQLETSLNKGHEVLRAGTRALTGAGGYAPIRFASRDLLRRPRSHSQNNLASSAGEITLLFPA
jgi:hypothetical protein